MTTKQAIASNLGYRCPVCRSIDWFRDGCLITEDEGGTVMVVRVQASDTRIVGAGWSCNYCAHELLTETRLAHDLFELERRDCG